MLLPKVTYIEREAGIGGKRRKLRETVRPADIISRLRNERRQRGERGATASQWNRYFN